MGDLNFLKVKMTEKDRDIPEKEIVEKFPPIFTVAKRNESIKI